MKVIAMYLPQFHHVKENDEWWGKDFTDWTTVKNAKPLYQGHDQPKAPLDQYYYDLTDKRTMEWQVRLMERFLVDGMCIYHYWFKDGKKILEKPAENLLDWKDIRMPFCFCWANETWARSWSNVKDKNVWADTFEQSGRKNGSGILLEQRYGEEEQWEEHYDYLLPFFKDSRYIRVDGKPLLVIYRASGIPCLREMLALWRKRAVEDGLAGLYVIGIWVKETDRGVVDAVLFHEPVRARFALSGRSPDGLLRLSYDALWDNILKAQGKGKTFFGGFSSYDDTPRRGKSGCLAEGAAPDKFARYLTELMAKNEACGNDMVFLNAWNEWGEGMCLEPDSRNRFGYLEAIPYAKERYRERVSFYREKQKERRCMDEETQRLEEEREKMAHYLNLMDAWMGLREKGIRLDAWLSGRGYQTIGIYGYGILGKHLVKELEGSRVRIGYIADRDRGKLPAWIPAFSPDEQIPETDILVVAATFYYDEICRQLKEKGIKKIVSLKRLIEEAEEG